MTEENTYKVFPSSSQYHIACRPGAVHARTQRLGGSGACSSRKFFNFRLPEIDSGEFWDAFPARQGARTNRGTNCIAAANLLGYQHCTHTPNDRSNSTQSRSHNNTLQQCRAPSPTTSGRDRRGCAEAVRFERTTA